MPAPSCTMNDITCGLNKICDQRSDCQLPYGVTYTISVIAMNTISYEVISKISTATAVCAVPCSAVLFCCLDPWRRCGDGAWSHQWPTGLCVQSGESILCNCGALRTCTCVHTHTHTRSVLWYGSPAQDFTVFGGSLSSMHAKKICKVGGWGSAILL